MLLSFLSAIHMYIVYKIAVQKLKMCSEYHSYFIYKLWTIMYLMIISKCYCNNLMKTYSRIEPFIWSFYNTWYIWHYIIFILGSCTEIIPVIYMVHLDSCLLTQIVNKYSRINVLSMYHTFYWLLLYCIIEWTETYVNCYDFLLLCAALWWNKYYSIDSPAFMSAFWCFAATFIFTKVDKLFIFLCMESITFS